MSDEKWNETSIVAERPHTHFHFRLGIQFVANKSQLDVSR